MNYKITKSNPEGEWIYTSIEFDYKGIKRTVDDIPHFHPKSEQQIHNGISNRIASEIRKIDAIELAASIQLSIDEEKTINYIPLEVEENPLAGYSVDELKQQITILSEEYNTIMAQREAINTLLQDNSTKYDLLIDELAKRV